jgi:hypothetical protein
MGASGIIWIDTVYDACIILLIEVAYVLNITYEEINVWLFCILWPILTVYQTLRIVYLKGKVNGRKPTKYPDWR